MRRILLVMLAVIVLCLGGCKEQKKEVINPDTKIENPTDSSADKQSMQEYVLYYTDSQAEKLYPVTNEAIPENADDPLFVMRELMKTGGSNDGKLINVIPPQTSLNSCELSDGVCRVDLSEEFLSIEGSATQKMAVYSIVNTLCRVKGVYSVQFVIDGELVEIFGNYLFDEPFEADMSLVGE